MRPSVATSETLPPADVVCKRLVRKQWDGSAAQCVFSDGSSLTVSRFLAGFLRPSDQIEFDPTAVDPPRELRVLQGSSWRPRELYFVSIGYVTQPKSDKRDEYFVRAEVTDGRLGVRHVHLRAEAVRDYFYFGNRKRPGCEKQTLYDLLQIPPSASPADLRLALKIRLLELRTGAAPKEQATAVERAFNLLAHPDLRSCYQALHLDPNAPALFPYGGFGALLAAGEISPHRGTFFASRILSFLPDRQERRFRAPLRKVEFFDGYAVYRDSRRACAPLYWMHVHRERKAFSTEEPMPGSERTIKESARQDRQAALGPAHPCPPLMVEPQTLSPGCHSEHACDAAQ